MSYIWRCYGYFKENIQIQYKEILTHSIRALDDMFMDGMISQWRLHSLSTPTFWRYEIEPVCMALGLRTDRSLTPAINRRCRSKPVLLFYLDRYVWLLMAAHTMHSPNKIYLLPLPLDLDEDRPYFLYTTRHGTMPQSRSRNRSQSIITIPRWFCSGSHLPMQILIELYTMDSLPPFWLCH